MKRTKNIGALLVAALLFVMVVASAHAFTVVVNNYDPAPAEAGKYVNVWFKVENPFSSNLEQFSDEDFYLEITPGDGLTLAEGESARKRIGVLDSGSSQTIQYRFFVADSAVEGPNRVQATLIVGSQETETDLFVEVVDKDFRAVDMQIGDVNSEPARIKPGDDIVELDVTIQNLDDGRAQGVKAELINLPSGITLSDSYSGTSLLGNILEDNSANAVFYIDVDESVESKEHLAQVKLTYTYKPDEDEDERVSEEVYLPLRIAVRPTPLYDIVNVSFSNQNIAAGDKDIAMQITVQNVGSEEGEHVRMKVYAKSEQPFTYDESSAFLSPLLKPGETATGTLLFDVDNLANVQEYQLDIEVKNVVNEDVITYNKKVAVEVAQPRNGSPVGMIVIAFLVVVGAGAFIVLRFIRNRRPKKAAKTKSSYGKKFFSE